MIDTLRVKNKIGDTRCCTCRTPFTRDMVRQCACINLNDEDVIYQAWDYHRQGVDKNGYWKKGK